MKKDQLHLADGLSVPATIAARTVFVCGTKGSGKTHNAGVLGEEMLAAGVHVVVLDPMGVWWGLRHDAKGGPGGHPVYILGGEHADAPLPPTSGEVVAEFVVGRGQSVILDMSGFASNADQDRFVTAFAAKLFRLKAAEKSALHLIMDEADQFMPQQPQSGTEFPLLGATKTIVTKGRSRGLSMTMITQRPQSIAKAAIEEADVVLCHRMQGVNAVKAMKAWTDLYATKEQAAEFFDTVPRLADGECWVWSPQFLKLFERHQFRRKATFDSSRTPDPGEQARKPRAAAAVDLGKLTADMQATAEAAKANDPAELRRQLAVRTAELARAVAAKPAAVAPAKVEVKVVDRPVLRDGQLDRAEKLLQVTFERMEKMRARDDDLVAKLSEAMKPLVAARREVQAWRPPAAAAPAAASAATPPVPPPPAKASTLRPPSADGPGATSPAMQKILDALAWWETVGVTNVGKGVLAVIAGYTVNGHFNNLLGGLRSAGLIGYPEGGVVAFTPDGRSRATFPEAPPTLSALHKAWKVKLTPSQWKIVEQVMAAHPTPLAKEDLAAVAGYTVNGHFNNMLGSLRSLGVITRKGDVGATSLLYPASLG